MSRNRQRLWERPIEPLEYRRLLDATDPVISEFMAANSGGLVDQFGEYADWIEIYNPGPERDLGGWYLTDKPSEPSQWWRFEEGTIIGAGQYKVVFATEGRDIRVGPELHANFSLDRAGETLMLVRPDGQIASQYAPYPEQLKDVSYGLGPASSATTIAVGEGSGAKALVPTNGDLGTTWTQIGFDSSGWDDAVTGIGFQTREAEPNNATDAPNPIYNFQNYAGNLYHLAFSGSFGSSEDWFKIGQLQAGDVITISESGADSKRGTLADPILELYRGNAQSPTLIASDTDSGTGKDALIARRIITATDTYYIHAKKPVGTGSYIISVFLENSGPTPATGGSFKTEVESNNTAAAANDASTSWRAVQYQSAISGNISSGDVDVYRLDLHQQDMLSIHVDSTSALATRVTLLDANGAVVAVDDGRSVLPDAGDSAVYGFVVPGTNPAVQATYFVKVESQSGTGSYTAHAYLSSPTSPSGVASDIGSRMYGVNSSLYVRLEFNGANPADISNMLLRMKYDDGFVAYLNGVPIASRNAPEPLAWDSAATAERPADQVLAFEEIDITSAASLIRPEGNVLAIQALNVAKDDGDFYILPELQYTVTTPPVEQYFSTSTPGAANQPGALGRVADTEFSVDRGYFDAPFDVAISTATTGAQIRYTLDGTDPTATTGQTYTGPIHIASTTVLKAAAFKPGFIPTDVDAQTYIFLDQVILQNKAGLPDTWGYSGGSLTSPPGPDYEMDPDVVNANIATIRNDLKSLPVVSLSMPMSDWFGASTGIYPQGSGDPRQMTMEFFTTDGAEQFKINGSVEIQGGGYGGTSADRWKSYKLSFQLKFKEIYGDPKLNFDLFGPDAASAFDTLILDAQINHTWLHPAADQQTTAKYINDQYMSDLQNAMGGYAPHGRFVQLYINGLYWGMYDLHERPDEHFAEEYLGGAADDYAVIKHSISNPANDPGAPALYQVLLDTVRADMTVPANYERATEILDIDDFIDYMLLNFYGGNADWAHKNWYATYNKVDPAGKWRFHSWDAEHTIEDVSLNNTGYNNTGGPTEIHQRLKANPEYRLRFADHVHERLFNDGALTPQRAAALYQALMTEVDRGIVGESARWGDNRRPALPYTREDWLATQNNLLASYFPNRTGILLGQLRSAGLYPAMDAPEFNEQGGTFDSSFALIISNPGGMGSIYYTLDGSDPRLPGGAISPSAILYTGPLTLNRSARVKARILGSEWTALTEATFIVGPPPGLRITEIMYHPQDPPPNSLYSAEDFEFIELANTGSSALPIGDFHFMQGITYTFPAGTTLDAGQRIVLARNPAAFQSRYGDAIPVFGTYDGSLDNAGERLTLATDLGQIIENFTYGGGWYEYADGGGFSLVATDPMASNTLLSTRDGWRASTRSGGSPGADEQGIAPGAVVINEVMSNGGAGGDWIELYNTGGADVDLGGWALSDSAQQLDKFIIPAGTWIRAGEYLLFTEGADFGTGPHPFSLSPLGGEVHLAQMLDGVPAGYRDSVDFAGSDPLVSFGRYVKSTGTSDFVAMSQPTPQGPNSYPLVGPIVINEIMYHPAVGGDEWVELRNISNVTVPLCDLVDSDRAWRFTAGIDLTFAPGSAIGPGGSALVVPIDPAAFRSKYNIPAGVPIFGPYAGLLDSAGEKLELSRPGMLQGDAVPWIVADRVHYNDGEPWPVTPDGNGPSLGRLSASGYANDVANWQAGPAGGTPGFQTAIVIGGSEGTDQYYLRIDPAGTDIQLFHNDPTFSAPLVLARTESRMVVINALGGDDLLVLDMSGGVPLPAGGVQFNAGSHLSPNGDAVRLINARGAVTFLPGAVTGAGTFVLAGASLQANEVESFDVSGPAELTVVTPRSADTLSIDSPAPGMSSISGSSGGEAITAISVRNLSTLILDTRTNGDAGAVINIGPNGIGGAGELRLLAGDDANHLNILGGTMALLVNSGALDLNAAAGSSAGVTINGAARLNLLGSPVLRWLRINRSGCATMVSGGNNTLVTDDLELATGAKLDLADNDAIIQTASAADRDALLAAVSALIGNARHDGAWDQPGITSSTAGADSSKLTGLAISGGEGLPAWSGYTFDANSVLIKYTFNGDADLNGKLDGSDYFFIDKAYLSRNSANAPSGYHNGDFDYSGLIDGSDYFLIDKAFLAQKIHVPPAPLAAAFSSKAIANARSAAMKKIHRRRLLAGKPRTSSPDPRR